MLKVTSLLLILFAYLFLILPIYKIIPYPLGEYTPLEWAVLDQLIVLLALVTSIGTLLKKEYDNKILSIFVLFLSFIPFILVTTVFINEVISGQYHLDYLFSRYIKY